jgi:predicted ABC-type ATPase
MSKIIQIIAGPNGSGKTTFAETYINNLKSNKANCENQN